MKENVGNRIVVIGPPGAGKSTLSINLGKITGIEVHHLDRLWWLPEWQESSEEEFDRKLDLSLSGTTWIMDGNYQRTIERRIRSSDTVIWLDFKRTRCLVRVFKRILKSKLGEQRNDITDRCEEKFDIDFMKWIWNYKRREWRVTMDLIRKYSNAKKIIILKTPKDVSHFLGKLHYNSG